MTLGLALPCRADETLEAPPPLLTETNRVTLTAWFEGFGEESMAAAAGEIARLGSASFRVRQAAEAQLIQAPALPLARLQEAAQHPDPEISARAQRILKEAPALSGAALGPLLRVIHEQSIRGLSTPLMPVRSHCRSRRLRAAWDRAFTATLTLEDQTLLERLAAGEDPSLALLAGVGLVNLKQAHGAAVLEKLLQVEDPLLRKRVASLLQALSGEDGGYNPDALSKTLPAARTHWHRWFQAHPDPKDWKLPLLLKPSIYLFNGVDLEGWEAFPADTMKAWEARNGLLRCNGQGRGYLKYPQAFTDYTLHLEWRILQAGADSGLWFAIPEEDKENPSGVEVQLLNRRVGDLYMLRGMEISVEGKQTRRTVQRKGASAEQPVGKWNQLELEVRDGKAVIRINDVLQHKVEGLPDTPTCIGLQLDGDPIEFRGIKMEPLN